MAFRYNEPDTVRVPKLNDIDGRVATLEEGSVPTTRTISTSAPLTGGGDMSANRTLAISAATTGAAGSMSAADKLKLDGVATGATNDTSTTVVAKLAGQNLAPSTVAASSFVSALSFLTADSHLFYSVSATSIGFRIGASGPYYNLRTVSGSSLDLNNSSGGDVTLSIAGTERFRATATGVTVPGLGTFSKTVSGGQGGMLRVANPVDVVAGTECGVDFSPNGAGPGVRSAQIVGINNGTNGTSLSFRVNQAGAGWTERMRINCQTGRVWLDTATLPSATNDAGAAAAGVTVGELYRNGSVLMVRVA